MKRLLSRLPVFVAAALLGAACGRTDSPPKLVIFSAGALAAPLRAAADSFGKDRRIDLSLEAAGSLETARKVTELGRTPDVIALADTAIFSFLLDSFVQHPPAILGRTRLVLAYTDRSKFSREINGENWVDVIRRPGVETGRSDPRLDPAGYRALMLFQLAGRYYRDSALARSLLNAAAERNVRPKSADLLALLETGHLDYAWEYESVAKANHLRYVTLPDSIDLGDPALAAYYDLAVVTLKVRTAAKDSVSLHGAPIVFGAAVLNSAPHKEIANEFMEFLRGPAGGRILSRYSLNGTMSAETQ